MASSISKMSALTLLVPVVVPSTVASLGYVAWRIDWGDLAQWFFTGPGRSSRIALLLFAGFNWKNMPLAWTYRVLYAILHHSWLRPSPALSPRALFKPMVTPSHTPLLEIDYNLHKSNSTYFADLDVGRSHLVSYLCRPGLARLADNAATRLVRDPRTDRPIAGGLGIMLGGVHCSFRREIAAYRGFELWTRVLAWDRKWLFLVTHFVPKGAVKPTEWLDPRFAGVRTREPDGDAADAGWEKKVYATAVSKYVFKVGRFTVNPAIVLHESGLLPDRPGGWTSGEQQVGDLEADVGDVDLAVDGEWDWRRVEAQRRKGMELASKFHDLDGLQDLFDGGSHGALARYGP